MSYQSIHTETIISHHTFPIICHIENQKLKSLQVGDLKASV